MRRWFVLVGLLMVGCGVSEPAPSPVSVEPTATVAPSASASMSQEELDAEAERVFRRAMEIESRWALYGDFSGFPAEATEVAMDEYLSSAQLAYQFLAEKQWTAHPDQAGYYESEPLPYVSVGDSVTALHVCKQFAGTHLYDRGGNLVSKGRIMESRYFFEFDTDGRLKISAEQYREVETCALYG